VLRCLILVSPFQITCKCWTLLPTDHCIHSRTFHFYCSYCLMGLSAYHLVSLKSDDIVYCPLPFYHTAGGALGAGQAILSGITVVIRRKFSASQYLPDCVRHNCTVRPMKIVTQNCGSFCLLFLAYFVLAAQYCVQWYVCILCLSSTHHEWHQFLHSHEGYVPEIITNTTHILDRVFTF
jgi:hypothetical protein